MLRRVRDMLKRSAFLVGMVKAVRSAREDWHRLRCYLRRLSIIRAYVREHSVRKLQLGAGRTGLPGWLNTDVHPVGRNVAYLDATQRFPLEDDVFHYVFSEHLIEHLTYGQGLSMLRECRRVLKPGGRLRIATPNLESIAGLLAAEGCDRRRRYIEWAIDEHIPGASAYRASFVVNNFFWDFKHLFVYDPATLSAALESVGFVQVTRLPPGESDDEELRRIESHGKRIGEEMNRFETMVFEAIKPL